MLTAIVVFLVPIACMVSDEIRAELREFSTDGVVITLDGIFGSIRILSQRRIPPGYGSTNPIRPLPSRDHHPFRRS